MLRFIAIILLFIIPIFSEDSDSLILETPKVFFSPNYDDINDTMVFQIKYSGSKTPVDWKIHIADENGKVEKRG